MAVLLMAGFENGETAELGTLGSGQSIVAEGDKGAYCLKNDGSGTTVSSLLLSSHQVTPKTRLYGGFRFKHGGTAVTDWFTDFHFYVGGVDCGSIIIWHDASGEWIIYLNSTAGSQAWSYIKSTDFAANVWHYFLFDFQTGASVTNTVWVDALGTVGSDLGGVGGFNPNNASNYGSGSMDEVRFGAVNGGTAIAADTLRFDDLVLDDAGVVAETCVISRQPVSTTPTYNAWTKSTASTIDTVWSETPPDFGTLAESAIAASAQTGVVAPFSATQSGHGSGVLGGSDILTGVKLMEYLKISNAGAAGVTEVGTAQSGFSTAGGNVTLTFSTAPIEGDVVIVTGGHILRTGSSYGPSTAGYTQIGTLQTSGVSGTGIAFGAWYKVMGPTPDTTVVCNGTSGTAGDGVGYTSKVLRQLANGVVLDVTAVFAGPTTSTNPDPPSITPVTANACVVIAGGSLVTDSNIGGVTNYTGQASANAAATRPYTNSILHRVLVGGPAAENPGAIGSGGNAWASGIWFSVSIALRPATEAGSAIKARYRTGGSDTDLTMAALTAGVLAARNSVCFADTAAHVNAAEIGVLHGNTSYRQDCTDVWLMISYYPSGSVDYAITASFAGAGALTANLAKNKTVAAGLAGAGALSAGLSQGMRVAASFSGLGALTANLAKDKTVEARFDGAGSLTALLRQGMIVNANFGGVGAILADVTVITSSPNHLITALFAGAGSLTANLAKNKTTEAALAGVGSLTSQINLGMIISSSFQGAGSLTANLVNSKTVEANFAGTGALIAALRQGMLVNAAFGGVGALTADLRRVLLVSSNFAGAGGLDASLSLNMRVSARLGGSGVIDAAIVSVAGVVTDWPITATFTGAGSLATQLNLGMNVGAAFVGAGALSSALSLDDKVNASFAGVGFLNAALSVNNRVQSNFAGVGALTAFVINSKTVEANFAGTGALAAALLQQMKVNAALAGAGSLTANLAKDKTVSASFAGAGALASGLNLGMQIRAIFSGVGSLVGVIDIQSFVANHAITALFAGAGNLVASLRVNNLVSASFAGTGVMTAFIRHNIRLTASFAGEGLMVNAQLRQNMRVRAMFQGEGLIDTSAIDVIPPVGTGQDTFFLVM